MLRDCNLPNMVRLQDVRAPVVRTSISNGWTPLDAPRPARAWLRRDGLKVLASCDQIEDGSWWLHVSLSRRDRMPSWQDLRTVKALFIGPNRLAVQVFPDERDYVNFHPHCLHLWSPDEG